MDPAARESSCPALPLIHIGFNRPDFQMVLKLLFEGIKLSKEKKVDAADNKYPLCLRLECVWCFAIFEDLVEKGYL